MMDYYGRLWFNPIPVHTKHPLSMVPMECGVTSTMVSFRGCLVLGGWDYLVNTWLIMGVRISINGIVRKYEWHSSWNIVSILIVHSNKMVHGQVISRIVNGRVKATIWGFPRMGC